MRGKTMEHAQKRKINFKGILTSSRTKRVALYALYFLAGLLGSRGMVFVRYAPFGAAAVAAVPIRSMWAVIAGSLVGYIWPSNAMHPIRYIAAIIAIAIIRCILNELVKIRSHPLFAPVVCFVPMLVTGIAMAFINGVTVNSITMYSAEAMLSAAGAYFFQRTSSLITSIRGVGTLNTGELACVVLSLGVAILALDNIAIYDISLGSIAAVILILFAAQYGGVAGGAIAGTATGVMLGLTTSGLSYISGAYAFAGLMAGLFAPLGKVALILVFILANAIGSLQIGNQMYMINGLYEVLAATLIYIIWPTKIGGKFIALFRQPVDLLHTDGLRRAVTMRLGFAAKALDDVTQSVDEVSKRLAVVNAQDSDQVYTNAVEECCENCGLRMYCWEKNQPETVQALQSAASKLGEKSSIGIEDFPGFFVSRCGRVNELAQNINHKYKEMQIRESAEKRVSQIRAMVMNQFETTSEMMRDFAQELELYERFDYDATQRINQVLHESAIIPIDVSCRIDRYNRMSVEIETPTLDQKKIGRTKLAKEISKVCGRRFEPPMISIIKDRCRIQMSEKPVYRIQFGVAQHACDNAQLCGDSYDCFTDGKGRFVAIISDGMGTGGRAAVDGAMASNIMGNLVKAGLGFECALKIVNSAMQVKSGEESLATLDVAVLDLFNGSLSVMKAGAPMSFIKKGRNVERLDAVSVPIGILDEAKFAYAKSTLEENNWLVMVSDGVLAAGDAWIMECIEGWNENSPQTLAETIVEKAQVHRTDGHDDDITVVAIQLRLPSIDL